MYLCEGDLRHRRHIQTLMEQRNGVDDLQTAGNAALCGGTLLFGQQHPVDGQVRILGGMQDHFGVGPRGDVQFDGGRHGCERM